MPKRKKFNIHDLYPRDYHFDWDAFEKDPDGYRFTEADLPMPMLWTSKNTRKRSI